MSDLFRLIATAISNHAWRRTGASADGSRHDGVAEESLLGEQGDEIAGRLAEMTQDGVTLVGIGF
jgi:hypothetical protein